MEPKRFSSAREAALQSGQADGPRSATGETMRTWTARQPACSPR